MKVCDNCRGGDVKFEATIDFEDIDASVNAEEPMKVDLCKTCGPMFEKLDFRALSYRQPRRRGDVKAKKVAKKAAPAQAKAPKTGEPKSDFVDVSLPTPTPVAPVTPPVDVDF